MQEARREEREPTGCSTSHPAPSVREAGKEARPPRKHPEAELGHLEFCASFCCRGRHGGLVNRCFRAITDQVRLGWKEEGRQPGGTARTQSRARREQVGARARWLEQSAHTGLAGGLGSQVGLRLGQQGHLCVRFILFNDPPWYIFCHLV